MNAKTELLGHIDGREVKYVHVFMEEDTSHPPIDVRGTLQDVLRLLDFEYDADFGGQNLFGYIWYTDGTWSERGVYDGSEWWEYKSCPAIPDGAGGVR